MKTFSALIIINCFLLSEIQSQGLGLYEISGNIGGGYSFYTGRMSHQPDLFLNYGGHVQLHLLSNERASLGIQIGYLETFSKVQYDGILWGSSYQPSGFPTEPESFQLKNWEQQWHTLVVFKGKMPQGFFGEIALGVNGWIDRYTSQFLPQIGLGGGYDIEISKLITIPLKIRLDYLHSFSEGFFDSGTLHTGLYAGIAFHLNQ